MEVVRGFLKLPKGRGMKYIRNLGLFWVFLIPLGSSAFIYEIKILRKVDKQGKERFFVGLSDFHDKSHPENVTQLKKIQELIGATGKNKVKFTVEDLSSQNDSGRFACGRFYVNSRGGVLGGLADTIKSIGHEVDNVEFRYCRVTTLGPVLNNLQMPLNTFASVVSTKISTVVDEINHTIAEIQSYADGDELKKIYNQIIKEVQSHMATLHLDQHKEQTVADYLSSHSNQNNRLDLLKKLLTFDSNLLDAKMIHTALQVQDKHKVIAIAGGSHIVRVCEILEKMGYKSVGATNISYVKEHDLQRCLGSHIIDGSYCVKPQPVSLQKLVDALK